jgi:hypothetical protein
MATVTWVPSIFCETSHPTVFPHMRHKSDFAWEEGVIE